MAKCPKGDHSMEKFQNKMEHFLVYTQMTWSLLARGERTVAAAAAAERNEATYDNAS